MLQLRQNITKFLKEFGWGELAEIQFPDMSDCLGL
jgi:hypothetical protein